MRAIDSALDRMGSINCYRRGAQIEYKLPPNARESRKKEYAKNEFFMTEYPIGELLIARGVWTCQKHDKLRRILCSPSGWNGDSTVPSDESDVYRDADRVHDDVGDMGVQNSEEAEDLREAMRGCKPAGCSEHPDRHRRRSALGLIK